MSQKTFSRRTVAIAVAASVAVGGAPVIGANGPLAAITPTANAQDAKRDVTKNVTADGLYYIADGDGYASGDKVKGNALPGANVDKSAEHRFTLTVGGESGLTAGDALNINIAPVKNPALPDRDSAVVGFINGQTGEIKSGDTVVGEWSTGGSGRVAIKMTEGAGEVLTETPVTFTVPSTIIPQSVTPEEIESLNGNVSYTQNGVQYNVTSGKNSTPISVSGFTVAYNYYAIPDYTNRNMSHFGGLKLDTRGDAASIKASLTVRAARANEPREWIELTVKPRLGNSNYGNNAPYADYTLIHPNELLDPGNMILQATAKDPEGKERSKKVDTPEGMTHSARIDKDGNLVVRFENVPADISPTLYFKNALVYDYVTPEVFSPEVMRKDNVREEPYGPFYSIGPRYAVTGSDVDNPNPKLRERKGDIRVTVNGSEAPQDDPQAIGGTTQKFTINLYNEGNTTLSAPTVTFPDGKTKQFKDVVLSPKGVAGDSTALTVDFAVPADKATLNWKVAYPKVDPITFTNHITPADQSDIAAGNIKYDTNGGKKEAPRGQVTTVAPSGVPKGASAARTPDTPAWAEIGPDGKLTLKPDNSAPLGRTEIPVKFTFPDGSETTVTPVITVAEEDKSKSTFDPRTQDEKSNDEINKRLDDLKKENADQAKKLGEIDAALDESNKLTKEQTDAIKDQTDKLGKSIDDQKKAIDALKEATEKGDKAIVDAMKEQSKAIDSALNSIETTIREGDAAALEEAKKQTAQLDKNNTLIAAQNKELANQTEQLKEQSATLKKQAATLEKVRAELDKANKLTEEQNKLIQDQIDAINAQTEAIGDLIDATEKQTAEITARLDDANKIAAEQRDIMGKELAESIKQTAEMKRQSKALERQNQILIDQHKDQLAQWEKENEFAQNEQDDRRHKDNFKRCITSDPATAALISLPIISLLAAVGVPYTGHMLEDANAQLTALNDQLGTQVNIPADLRAQVNDFNANYGDMVRTGATALAGIGAVVGLAVAINNLTGGCYAEADKSVGREPQAPKSSSESVLSSKPWVQETTAPKADAEANAEAEGTENAEVATQ